MYTNNSNNNYGNNSGGNTKSRSNLLPSYYSVDVNNWFLKLIINISYVYIYTHTLIYIYKHTNMHTNYRKKQNLFGILKHPRPLALSFYLNSYVESLSSL